MNATDGADRSNGLWLFWQAALDARSSHEFTERCLAAVCETQRVSGAQLLELNSGAWQATADAGTMVHSSETRHELAERAWDSEQPIVEGGLVSIPWKPSLPDDRRASVASRVLVLELLQPHGDRQLASQSIELGIRLGEVVAFYERGDREQHELERLQAVLEEVVTWSRSRSIEEVLEQIARSATRLLKCERATIFLWDKPRKKLIGRPALGVPGNLLEVPDHVGVVGQILGSGDSIRVSSRQIQENDPIHRDVDRKLSFHTRNLMGVPLENASASLKGVFEVLNRESGEFTSDDERTLQLLAQHAAAALVDSRTFQRLAEDHRRMIDHAAQQVALVGECQPIQKLRDSLPRIAKADLAVLILGENGSGKDIVAQQLHYLSPRRDRPWLAINCASIAETLLESELFGHEKGAFTGAYEVRVGKFEAAHGGTVFLDEIGDLSLDGQAALLRVLEDKIVTRIGGVQPITVDTRVIAATNRDLAQRVREGKFREDLYYRLNVVTLQLPPLRERGSDILLLADHFLQHYSKTAGRTAPKLSSDAQRRLMAHPWSGNVRELRNLMERLVYLCDQDPIGAEELAFTRAARESAEPANWDLPLSDATRAFQIELIQRHITRAQGNVTLAAKTLGLHRSNLYRKMQLLGMPTSEPPLEE